MTVIPFKLRGDGNVFTRTGCELEILSPVSDGSPVCFVCRWFDARPKISREVRDLVVDIMPENGCGNG